MHTLHKTIYLPKKPIYSDHFSLSFIGFSYIPEPNCNQMEKRKGKKGKQVDREPKLDQ